MTIFWIVLGVIILILVVVLLSDSAARAAREFVTSQPVRNITAQFLDTHVKSKLIQQCKYINPFLTANQVQQLDVTLTKAIIMWRDGKDIKPLIRGIVALAVPYGDYIYDLIEAFFKHSTAPAQPLWGAIAESKNNSPSHHSDDKSSLIYVGIDSQRLSRIPNEYLSVIKNALFDIDNPPICGITLEPIVNNGKLASGVMAVIHRRPRGVFCYLFYKEHLEMWLSRKLINPMTREVIDPSRELFYLS